MPGAFSGALLKRYTVDVSALPGTVTQERHNADTDTSLPDDMRDRDDAPLGGGWQPDAWDQGQVPVGTGGLVNPEQDHNHTATGHHAGSAGGSGRYVGQDGERTARPTRDQHTPADLTNAGSAGAAFGGMRKTGSMDPYANPGGVRLGHVYKPVADNHRQGLHFNRPGLRLIRQIISAQADYDGFGPDAGVSQPRLRRQIAPAGQSDYLLVDQRPAADATSDHGNIGGQEWVM